MSWISLCYVIDFLTGRGRFQFFIAREKSRSLFLFCFSFISCLWFLDVIERILDRNAKGACDDYEGARDELLLLEALEHTRGIGGKNAKEMKEVRNGIDHGFITVGSELSHFVLSAILNGPRQASEPYNCASRHIVASSTFLDNVAHTMDHLKGLGGNDIHLIDQFLRLSGIDNLLWSGRALLWSSHFDGRGQGSEAGRATGSGHGISHCGCDFCGGRGRFNFL